MRLVPVEVDTSSVSVKVYRHEGLAGVITFEPVRARRLGAAGLLDIQTRMTNVSRKNCNGTHQVDFLDSSGRRLSTTGRVPFSLPDGGSLVIEARAGSPEADAIEIRVRGR